RFGSAQKRTREHDWSYGRTIDGSGLASSLSGSIHVAREPMGASPLGTSSVTCAQPAEACEPNLMRRSTRTRSEPSTVPDGVTERVSVTSGSGWKTDASAASRHVVVTP